jgi:toxin ParE1/3/4
MRRAFLSPAAEEDLAQIFDYIALDNDEAAERFVRSFRPIFELLGTNPLMGRDRSDLRSGIRSFPHKRYIIFYVRTDRGIQVNRVLHGARDIPAIFLEESE